MYLYKFISSFPEGANYTNSFYHEKKYTNEQFAEICENILLEFCKKPPKDIDSKLSIEFRLSDECGKFVCGSLCKMGFKVAELTAFYDIEPYWNKDCIRNEELKKLLEESF